MIKKILIVLGVSLLPLTAMAINYIVPYQISARGGSEGQVLTDISGTTTWANVTTPPSMITINGFNGSTFTFAPGTGMDLQDDGAGHFIYDNIGVLSNISGDGVLVNQNNGTSTISLNLSAGPGISIGTSTYGGNTMQGLTCTADSDNGGFSVCSWAFDGNIGPQQWGGGPGAPPHWVYVDYTNSNTALSAYGIATIASDITNPTEWTFQGSQNHTSWTDLDSQTGQTLIPNVINRFTFTNTTGYRYYRFYFTANGGGNGVSIAELTGYTCTSNCLPGLNVNNTGIIGSGNSTQIAYFTGNGTSTLASNSKLFFDSTNTRLAIGTTSALSTLHVHGNVSFTGSSTIITPAIGGGIVGGGCDSATSTIDSTVTSSTAAFITTPQNDPGSTLGGAWFYSFLSAPGVLTTRVCANVTLTPNTTAYVVKVIK